MGEGVTKIVEGGWNYYIVYISASDLRFALGVGITIGEVFIKSKIISVVLGILGLSLDRIEAGIWFHLNKFCGLSVGAKEPVVGLQ